MPDKTPALISGAELKDPRPGICRTCFARIWWVKTPAGKPAPYDREPNEAGNFVSHFATCPQAKEWRQPREPKGGTSGRRIR